METGALLRRRTALIGVGAPSVGFPRKEYVALSTLLAILFWLALAAVIVCTTLAVRNKKKPLRGRPLKKNKTHLKGDY